MNCCDTPGLLPLENALDTLLSSVEAIQNSETLSLESALDRVLADDIHSPIDVPGFDNSAMDGYALSLDSKQASSGTVFEQIGKVFAGAPFEGELKPGQCVRIMTGGEVPSSANTVVMQENTHAEGDKIELSASASLGANIRLRGNDIASGACVLKAGRRLKPADLGLIASLGFSSISVFAPLKVGLFSSGDELQQPGEPLKAGCIYESNRFVIKAMLQRMGMEILDLGIIPDSSDALKAAFKQASQECDAIISSGGVSVGEADYTKDVLSEIGEINFWKLAIKPGKPFAFGHIDGKPFFGLPGNPSSAAVTFHQLALPCLQKMAGCESTLTPTFVLPAPAKIRKRPGRTDFQRAELYKAECGEWRLSLLGSQSSGMLSSLSAANCYIKLGQDRYDVEAGELVEVIPFDRWMI